MPLVLWKLLLFPPFSFRQRFFSLSKTTRTFSSVYLKLKQFPEHASLIAIDVFPNIHHNYIIPSERRSGLTIASRVNIFCQKLQFRIPDIQSLPALNIAPFKLRPRYVPFLFTINRGDPGFSLGRGCRTWGAILAIEGASLTWTVSIHYNENYARWYPYSNTACARSLQCISRLRFTPDAWCLSLVDIWRFQADIGNSQANISVCIDLFRRL